MLKLYTGCIYFILLNLLTVFGAPVNSKPWVQPCAGDTLSGFRFKTPIVNPNAADALQRLRLKTKVFLSKIDHTFSYIKKDLVTDGDMIMMLNQQPKTANFPEDLQAAVANALNVNQENYLKLSKLYIFLDTYKHLNVHIDEVLHDLSDGLVSSVLDILCECNFLVDLTGYQPISLLDMSNVKLDYSTLTATQFYSWDYVMLRDIKNLGHSILDFVNNGRFNS